METTVKKSNKENKPDAGLKKIQSRNGVILKPKLMKPAPLQSKNDVREEQAGSKGQIKTDADPKKKQTLSQAFRTEQSIRHRKLVIEAQKPPASVPPKPAPGTYKGRVVRSKIDCFRKPTGGDEKIVGAKPEPRSKSVTAVPGSSRARLPPHLAGRVKSLPDVQKAAFQKQAPTKGPVPLLARPAPSAKPPTVLTRPATVPARSTTTSVRPNTAPPKPTTVTKKSATMATKPSTVSNKPAPMPSRPATISTKPTSFIRKKEPTVQVVKPKPGAAPSQQKPPRVVSSSISQYRVCTESAEERRAKLASWLASKGKSLKRPTMMEKAVAAAAVPRQTSKPQLSIKEAAQPEPVTHSEIQPDVTESKPAFSSSPSHIINTTLDLLENSDLDLPVDPEIRLESLVINLCDRLEAMETPSSCESAEAAAGGSDEAEVGPDVKVQDEVVEGYEILEEEAEEVKREQMNNVTLKEEEEEDEEKPVKAELNHEQETKLSDDEDEDEKMESPDVTEACVVKYSVKTTPFLQSVKKVMDCEMKAPRTPSSRRKSGIKDLKFLTPVRRSSRIHRNSSRLPEMLNEHDPCVSSLAELELLDAADSNAYIYRRNPALLQHLPEQPLEQPPEPQNLHTEREVSGSAP